ncbi:MAG TPA: amidohydrolase family protein [Actinomycetota bacterium]|nr:amidohydrolase family protein [Actinomycetota bacterium]
MATPAAVVFRGARVFDGFRLIPGAEVLVVGDTIAEVAATVEQPAGAEVVDASGCTLLPGLIDCHTHTWGPDHLKQALVFGVTTELDMFTDPDFAASMRAEQAGARPPDRADLLSAGLCATAPGGHGTQYGIPVPALTEFGEADAFVQARLAEGSDYIKIIRESGNLFGRPIPSLDRRTAAAVIDAARRRDKLSLVHVMTLEHARESLEDRASGLAHLFVDMPLDEATLDAALTGAAFVVPTLTVLETACGTASGRSLAEDPNVRPYLTGADRIQLCSTFGPVQLPPGTRLGHASEAVTRLASAGVPVLVGSDAPNPGTLHGASVHRELELLVEAGMAPEAALSGATGAAARCFRLLDRGVIAAGKAADLVLVSGDPTQDILATRDIRQVWKAGVRFDRESYAAALESAVDGPSSQPPVGAEEGLLSDFDDGTLSARFGCGWTTTTDRMAGGSSVAETSVVEPGAAGSRAALSVSGEVREGFAFPWAGAMAWLGKAPMASADLSPKREVSFWCRGEPRELTVAVMVQGIPRPIPVPFECRSEWTRHSFALSDFAGADGSELIALLFWASAYGPFEFELDEVRFD